MLGEERYDETQYQLLRKKLGLDRPLYMQYSTWLDRLAHGDLGQSLRTQRAVLETVVERYPATIYLALASLILGTYRHSGGNFGGRQAKHIVGLFGNEFCPVRHRGAELLVCLAAHPGFRSLSGLVSDSWVRRSIDVTSEMFLWYLTLPAIVLGTDMASTVTRYVRAEMLEQLKLDYVRTARAKGVPRRWVVYKHTLRNSLIAATTVIGLHVGRLLGGSTVVETIFAWPGLGRLVLEAVYARDYPLLQGAVLFLASTYVVVNLLVDILYKWLDPRISLN